jgi:hypothetical protein
VRAVPARVGSMPRNLELRGFCGDAADQETAAPGRHRTRNQDADR